MSMELDSTLVPELAPTRSRKLSTFTGVFTPVCLSMFSAILFLRLGYILGNAGLLETIAQLLVAYTILIFTVLSVSAISTNGEIEGGGIYFMSSRVLGPEFGGSIGTLFFVANVVSSALYITGCVEGLINNFGPSGTMSSFLPAGGQWPLIYASGLNLLNLLVCLVGAAMFARTTLVIFTIVLSIAISVMFSLIFQPYQTIPVPKENAYAIAHNITNLTFTGLSFETFKSNLFQSFHIDYTTGEKTTFAIIFGVCFTGVTGVLAGANISGDLKNPSKSIPRGTIGGMIFTFFVYLTLFILSAASCSRQLLQNNYLYMTSINVWPLLVEIGISFATISASLSNLIGASRLLAAVVGDQLFGRVLDPLKRFQTEGNPVGSVIVTWLIVQLILLIGSLNKIAQLSSVLFLFTYFSINLACMVCLLTSAPNFRPSFRYFNLPTTLMGMIGGMSMMFVISTVYSSVVIAAWLLLMVAIHLRSPPLRWGDITQALIFHQVRKYLLLLDLRKEHVKYWRPRILLMVANPRSCMPLIDFVNDLKKSGLFVLGHVKLGNLDDYEFDPIDKSYNMWLKWLGCFDLKAFIEMTLASSVREGLAHLSRIAGLGAMKLNTIMFGFYDDELPIDFFEGDAKYLKMKDTYDSGDEIFEPIRSDPRMSREEYVAMIIDSLQRLQKNVCIARNFQYLDKNKMVGSVSNYYLDVWPVNFFNPHYTSIDNSSSLLIQFACILNMVSDWKKHTSIRIFICGTHSEQEDLYVQWQKMLEDLRVDASINIVVWDGILSSLDDGPRHLRSQLPAINRRSMLEVEEYRINSTYLNAINSLIKQHSSNTAVTFLYLPTPPRNFEHREKYLRALETMTNGLPPTLLVHGNGQVISTSI